MTICVRKTGTTSAELFLASAELFFASAELFLASAELFLASSAIFYLRNFFQKVPQAVWFRENAIRQFDFHRKSFFSNKARQILQK